jgi:hypothetical protein
MRDSRACQRKIVVVQRKKRFNRLSTKCVLEQKGNCASCIYYLNLGLNIFLSLFTTHYSLLTTHSAASRLSTFSFVRKKNFLRSFSLTTLIGVERLMML